MTDLITKGMSDWKKPINDFAKNNAITAGAWSDVGITCINGVKVQDGSYLKYAKTTYGEIKQVVIHGWITIPTLKFNEAIQCVQLPSSLFGDFVEGVNGLQLEKMGYLWGDQVFKTTTNYESGIITLKNLTPSGDRATISGGVELVLSYIYY